MTAAVCDLGDGGMPPQDAPVLTCLRYATGALGEAADARCWSLDTAQKVAALELALAVRAQADELVSRLLNDADRCGVATASGATSTAAWVAAEQRVSFRDAAATVRLGKALDRYEATRQALAAGVVHTEQGRVIVHALDDLRDALTGEQMAGAEQWLLEQAATTGPDDLRLLGRRAFHVFDPEGADRREGELLEGEERRAAQHTRLVLRRRGDGTTQGSFRIPDLAADMLRTALEALSSPRRDHRDRAETQTPHALATDGDSDRGSDRGSDSELSPDPDPEAGPGGHDLRPYPVRMGQALCELVEHLPVDELPQAGGVAATVTVMLDYQALTTGLGAATLSSGGRVSAGQARRLACTAGLIPAVFDGDSVCLDMGRTRRLHTRQQRIAIGLTQQGCIWPGCSRPPAWCEIHHPTPWSRGGTTSLEAAMVCPRHHHLAHDDWSVRVAADGIPEVIPPTRIDPHQTPRRHHRFRPRRT